jgi:hypothetical protein
MRNVEAKATAPMIDIMKKATVTIATSEIVEKEKEKEIESTKDLPLHY